MPEVSPDLFQVSNLLCTGCATFSFFSGLGSRTNIHHHVLLVCMTGLPHWEESGKCQGLPYFRCLETGQPDKSWSLLSCCIHCMFRVLLVTSDNLSWECSVSGRLIIQLCDARYLPISVRCQSAIPPTDTRSDPWAVVAAASAYAESFGDLNLLLWIIFLNKNIVHYYTKAYKVVFLLLLFLGA